MEAFDLSPGQVMPMVWRVLRTIEMRLKTRSGASRSVFVIFCIRMESKEINRCTFYFKPKRPQMVLNTNANDRGWKARFAFAERESLPNWMVAGWNSGDGELFMIGTQPFI